MTGSAQARTGWPRLRHRRLGVIATLFAAGGAIAASGSGTAAAQGEAPDGESLYQTNCAGCHGAEGEGGVGPVLQGIVNAHGVEDVTNAVRNGIEAQPVSMPAWEGVLTDDEIDAVVAYVATFEGEHTHEHDDHGDDHGDDPDDGHDHGDGQGDDHDDGHGDDHDHDSGTGQPAPPVAGDPGFTG